MNYTNYHRSIVEKFHVRLVGLPDLPVFSDANGPIKPFNIKDHGTLEALHAALESGACHWDRMSPEDIADHGDWLKTQVVTERAVRSDVGKKRGRRQAEDSGVGKNKNTDSSSRKRQRTNANSSASRKHQHSTTTTKGTQASGSRKSQVSKQLPPQLRSRSVVEDEDSNDEGSSYDDDDS